MPTAGWRTWAGLLLALIGAAALFLVLSYPAPEYPSPPPGTGHWLDLTLMGKKVLSFPAGAGDVSAALRLARIALPLALLFLGAFLLFLETDAGAKFAALVRKRLEKEDI